jgi:hypothetical protein
VPGVIWYWEQRKTIESPLAVRSQCIFSLSYKVIQTSESPTNLTQIQTIISGVSLVLKRDEKRRQMEETQKSQNEKSDFSSSIMTNTNNNTPLSQCTIVANETLYRLYK